MFRLVRAAAVRVAAIAAVVVVLGSAAPARADNVDELIRQLGSDGSDKVRLSAALNLTKLRDRRAIGPLAKALVNDTEATVRAAAAGGLGKLVNAKTDANDKKDAVEKLTLAKNSDPSNFVRVEADKALQAIGGGGGSTPQTPPQTPQTSPGGCYMNIGPMASKTSNPASINAGIQAAMVKTANNTMTRASSRTALTWPGGGVPTQAMLSGKGMLGFYLDGTTSAGAVNGSGSSMTVSCKISMLLAEFPNKSVFAFLSGGGSVQSSGTAADFELCVSAVVEDLIRNKIVPTIQSKGCP